MGICSSNDSKKKIKDTNGFEYYNYDEANFSFENDPRVFFDLEIDGVPTGRIVIKLYGKKAPKTVENFRQLCTGCFGKTSTGSNMCYEGTLISKVVSGVLIQGGDINYPNGVNECIYGIGFENENFEVSHHKPGIISMAGRGDRKDSNCSQFFFSMRKNTSLDGKYVAFGRVVKGIEILREIEKYGMEKDRGKINVKIVIKRSGEINNNNNNNNNKNDDE